MQFRKGDTLKVTIKSQYIDVEDRVEMVKVEKVIKRNGITRLYVRNNCGTGYSIPLVAEQTTRVEKIS